MRACQSIITFDLFDLACEWAIDRSVLYVTRIQRERFSPAAAISSSFLVIDSALMQSAKRNMLVMHPLPRTEELSTDLDSDPRAAYFIQMEAGLYVRMALLAMVLGRVPAGW
jgi:aspartate carbamoyltransferase catalytic subunit